MNAALIQGTCTQKDSAWTSRRISSAASTPDIIPRRGRRVASKAACPTRQIKKAPAERKPRFSFAQKSAGTQHIRTAPCGSWQAKVSDRLALMAWVP